MESLERNIIVRSITWFLDRFFAWGGLVLEVVFGFFSIFDSGNS